MLDVFSFIEERGGNPEAIRESQRRRHAPVEVVDEIIEMYGEARAGRFCDFFNRQLYGLENRMPLGFRELGR